MTAAHAVGSCDIAAETRSNICTLAAIAEVDGVDVLDLIAHSHALAAEDALAGITDDAGRGIINGQIAVILAEAFHIHIVPVAVGPQFAGIAHIAGGAVGAVGTQQELENHLAEFLNLGGIGLNDQTCLGQHGAGGVDLSLVVFDDADAATAIDGQIFAIAEGRNVNAVIARHFQNIAFTVNGALNIIDDHHFRLVSISRHSSHLTISSFSYCRYPHR